MIKKKTNTTRRHGNKEIKTIKDLPVSTAHQSRLRLFQATRRPERGEWTIETAWGKVKIKGRLGQTHADVVESMLFVAEKVNLMPDKRLRLLVDPYKIKKTARQLQGQGFTNIIDDIMGTVIEIIEPVHLAQIGHLIDNIYKAVDKNGNPLTKPNPLGGENRNLWTIVLGEIETKLIKEDLGIKYNPICISCLRHGSSQALARLVLSHDKNKQPAGGWKLDTLINQIYGEINKQKRRNCKREIIKDSTALTEAGININKKDNRVSRI